MIALQRPSTDQLSSYLTFIAEMKDLGETIWDGMLPRASESPSVFVERLLRAVDSPEPGLVAASSYWAVGGGEVVGRIALRHELNASLEEFGGHVGYEVRPSARKRGIAREMLRQLLELPKAREIGRILVTCAPDNVGSNKAILANGGVLARTAFVEKWQRQTNYYWIDLRRSDVI
jgi:predicted acetyltransferase